MSAWLAFIAALIVLAACVFGVKAKKFRDNWLQHAGLWVSSFASLAYLFNPAFSARETALLCGVALFAVGTAIKFSRMP
jgi:uncharacterized membrane protein HdeD (DUF308 family)